MLFFYHSLVLDYCISCQLEKLQGVGNILQILIDSNTYFMLTFGFEIKGFWFKRFMSLVSKQSIRSPNWAVVTNAPEAPYWSAPGDRKRKR